MINSNVTRPLTSHTPVKSHLPGRLIPVTDLRDYCLPSDTLEALKELGFDHKDQFVIHSGESSKLPLMDEVIDWLYYRHKVLVYTTPHEGTFFYHVDCPERHITIKRNSIPTRREAELKGILRAIELLQTQL